MTAATPPLPWRLGYRVRAIAIPATLIAVTLVALILRIAWLGDQVIWPDERSQLGAATSSAMFAAIREHAAAAPLDYFGTRLMAELFGPTYAIRLWPALIGTATIPLLYLAGRRYFDARVGMIAAALLALAPFHIYYSGEARYYALSAFVAVVALLAFRTRWFAAAVALTLYSFYFAFLVPVALVVIHRSGWRALVLGVVAWLPWALYALPSQIGHRQDIGDLSTIPTPALVAQVLVPDFDVSGLPWIVPATVLILAGGLALLGARRAWWIGLIVVAAVVLTGISTAISDYFWSPRQVLFTLPLILLVMAVGWTRHPRYAGIAVLVVWVALMVPFIDGMTGADAWHPRTPTLMDSHR